jgi:hypothetical protein
VEVRLAGVALDATVVDRVDTLGGSVRRDRDGWVVELPVSER